MERVVLRRFETSNFGTFGFLQFNGFRCFTLELPDRNNQPNLSCIPKGTYKVVWTVSERLRKPTYELLDVPQRAGIRVHSGNLAGDTQKGLKCQFRGCIALGHQIGVMEGQKALLVSRPAIRAFEELMQKQPFLLEIQ